MSAGPSGGMIEWMTRHRVAPNILMAVLLIGGLGMSTIIKQEVFPNFTDDTISIVVPFPGASPEEVEEGIILAVEEEVRGLDGVGEVRATASEGRAVIFVEILLGADPQQVNQDVKQAVDRIRVFPEDAEDEIITLSSRKRSVIDMQLYGDVSEWTLRQAAEQVRDGLLQQPGITQVELEGARDMEILVEVPEATLREYGLTLASIGRVLAESALDRAGGAVDTSSGEILVRVQERREWAQEFENIPVVAPATGAVVRLGDIATIREAFEDTNTFGTFEGKRSIGMLVYRIGDQTPIGVADAVYDALPDVMSNLPPGIEIAIQDDDSEIYRQRLELLLKNGLLGLCLVLGILSIFLEFRLAFWVAMGIPTAFLGTLLFLPWFDVSINMVSMFAFILALGIVVDDAIVAGENIYEYRMRGMSHLEAAFRGARDIAIPISYSIITNIVAFIPLATVPGTFGKIWGVIPVVVITAFCLSWLEAMLILPAHLAHVKEGGRSGIGAKIHHLQQMIANGFTLFAERVYGPVLAFAMNWRYGTIAIMMAILGLVLSIPASGRMGFILMPQVEGEYAQATAVLPVGAPLDDVLKVRDKMVDSARVVLAENGGEKLGTGVFALVQENVIEVRAYLVEQSLRTLSTSAVTQMWREKMGSELAGLESLRFEADAGGPGRGPKVSVELSHRNVETLERAAADLAERLEQFASVNDVDDGYSPGKVQLDFKVTDEGRALGLDAAEIARQVRGRFYGIEALRQQRGRNEVTLKVRLPEEERTSEADLEKLILITPDGGEAPLYELATVTRGRAYTDIQRRDGRRIVTVTSNVEPVSETSKVLAALTADIMPQLMADYPGLSYSFEGRQADMRDSLNSFYWSCGLALFVIFMLLAVPFRSYVQPLIVMVAIPFGVVGAILGHLLMGFSLSMISIMGIIALSGVVINGALVMVDYANARRAEGFDAFDAIHSAGVRRFRPIWLTTMTTFGGLAPMIFENSRQARFLIPMALSLGYGIVFATVIILVLVPALYMMVEDIIWVARGTASVAAPGLLKDDEESGGEPKPAH
ncbi:MAG: AcrB/AcrD/AcrF family protein [Candidatus Hydrogenedens sp.]|nr:AcrB/AcrD/AcrF family protein [Candidatus Hydrogenedens sp.]